LALDFIKGWVHRVIFSVGRYLFGVNDQNEGMGMKLRFEERQFDGGLRVYGITVEARMKVLSL
jgi:hypothetical protein